MTQSIMITTVIKTDELKQYSSDLAALIKQVKAGMFYMWTPLSLQQPNLHLLVKQNLMMQYLLQWVAVLLHSLKR